MRVTSECVMKTTPNRHYTRAATSRLFEAIKQAKTEMLVNTLCHGFSVERETIVCDIVRRLLEKECGAHCDVR